MWGTTKTSSNPKQNVQTFGRQKTARQSKSWKVRKTIWNYVNKSDDLLPYPIRKFQYYQLWLFWKKLKKLLQKSYTSLNLTVPLCKKTSCRGFSYYASRLWNSMPTRIKALGRRVAKNEKSRLNNFKKEVKKWIWEGGVPFK